jgi:DNA-binding XRE family transcriptional regulator
MTRGNRLPLLKARREAAGLMTVTALAQLANVSDRTIQELENGGNCDDDVMHRILDVLGPSVAITSSSIADPTVITTAAHRFVSGDTVTIAGHTSSTPAVDGDRVVTVVNGTSFTVPLNVSDDGVGGTARLSPTTLGIARL